MLHTLWPAPLGHDEARYALDARDLLAGTPSRFIYSGGAMALVPIPGLWAGASERALRALPIALGFVFLFIVWHLARRTHGRTTAAFTLGVLATSPQLAVHSSELLSDVPSAACLLGAVALLIEELTQQPRIRWRVVWIAPLFALAFYLRYGSSASIGVIGIVMAITGQRAIRTRPLPILAAVVLFALLLVPHFVRAHALTGSPLGVLRLSAEIPGEAAGLLAYARSPLTKYGLIVSVLMVLGLGGVFRNGVTRAFVVIAVGQIVLLAFTTQARPRFIYVATVLLVIAGIDVVARAIVQVRRGGRIATVVCALALVPFWLNELMNVRDHRDRRFASATATHAAAIAIQVQHTAPCTVVATSDATRLEWYSGCHAVSYEADVPGALYEVRAGACRELRPGARCIAMIPGVTDVIRLR